MKPGSAAFRRANRQPGYKHMPREEYLQRAVEFAKRGEAIAKKLTRDDVLAIRANVEGMTDRQRAESLVVSKSLIYQIRHYEKWGCAK